MSLCAGIQKAVGTDNMIRVEVDDVGPVEFPDGTSKETMNAVLTNRFGKQPEPKPIFSIDEPGGPLPQRQPETKREHLTAYQPGLIEQVRGSWAMRKLLGPTAIEREGMIDPGVSPMDLVGTAFKFMSPPPQISEAIRQTTDPLIQRTGLPEDVQGMATGAREAFLNFPWGAYGLSLGSAAGKALLGVFTGEYAFQIPEAKAQFETAVRRGDQRAAGQIVVENLLNGALLATAAVHLTGRGEPLTRQQEAVVDAIESTLQRPIGLPNVDQAARDALSQRAGELQAPLSDVPEAPPPTMPTPDPMGTFHQVNAPMPKRNQPVEVPGTPPEPERGLTVLQEIRQKGAKTKEQIRSIFPQLSREQAAELRRLAWPDDPMNQPQIKVEAQTPSIMQDISKALARGDLKAVKKLSKQIPDEFTGVSESIFNLDRLNDLAPQTAEALRSVTEQTKGVEDASQIPSPKGAAQREVRPLVGEETPLRQQGEIAQAQAETPAVEIKPTPVETTPGAGEPAPALIPMEAVKEGRNVPAVEGSDAASEWFHSSHQNIGELSAREIENIDTVGTWLTGDKNLAKTLYGPITYKAEVTPKNLLEAHTENFDEFFYSNHNLFKELFPNEPQSTFEAFKESGLKQKDKRAYDMRAAYLRAFRQMLQDAGYDGIVWKNSRIDLGKSDKPHDVAVIFHDQPISVKKLDAQSPAIPESRTTETAKPAEAAPEATTFQSPNPWFPPAFREKIINQVKKVFGDWKDISLNDPAFSKTLDELAIKLGYRKTDNRWTDARDFLHRVLTDTGLKERSNQETAQGRWLPANTNDAALLTAINDILKPLKITEATAAVKQAERAKPVTPESRTTETAKPAQSGIEGIPIVWEPISELTLSTDVPQFKAGANERGVVEPLGGKFDPTGMAPLQGWRRLDGRKQIISGRHRLDLAERSGEKVVPVQWHYESNGFDKRAAARLDAELNIRDEQGTISDYANYFKNSDITEADAQARGLLARGKGKAGFSLARKASEDVFALHQAGKLTDAQATAIADVAPSNEGLQALGIRAALKGKGADEIADLITLAKNRADANKAAKAQGDLFSFDDSAIRDMEAQAALSAKERNIIREQVQAVKGASRKPEIAAKLGVDVKDPKGVIKRIAELEKRIEELKRHPELAGKSTTEKPFELEKAESVEEQKARLATEEAEAKRKADKEKLLERQQKPLEGTTGDIGQQDMFGSGDLFAQPPKPLTPGPGAAMEGGAQGALGGPGLSPAASTTTALTPKGQDQIIRDLAKGLKLPIRFGRLRTSKFAGYFLPIQKLIGTKKAVDVPSVSHEVGHALETSFSFTRDPGLTSELDHLGDNARPGSRSSWTPSKTKQYKYEEGVAEFVRYWLTDPAEARKLGQNMERAFNAMLDANKDVGDTLRTAQEDIRLWRTSNEEARLHSHISTSNPNETPYTISQLTRDLVDDLHVTRLVMDDAARGTGSPVNVMDDMYKAGRLLRGSFGMAETFINKGVVDWKTKSVQMGTSLEDALKPVAGRLNEFRGWIVAKRAQELHRNGKSTGLLQGDIDATAAKYDAVPEFQEAFQKVKSWNDSLLKYVQDSGMITPNQAAAMRAMNRDYVPFHRLFEVGAGEMPAEEGLGTGRGLNLGTPGSLRRQTGSVRPIIDPLETMVKNAYALVTAAEKAAIHQQIAKLSELPGMGKWVEKIATPKEHVQVGLEKIRKQLENAGADLTNVPDDLMLEFYRQAGRAPWGENIIRVKVGDKAEFYRLNKELFETFHALDYEDSGKIIRMMSGSAQLLRAGVTLTPDFALFNAMRDAFSSAIISKHWMLPGEATLRGLAALLRDPKMVAEWAASGGKFSVEVNYFDRAKLQKYLMRKIANDLTPSERAAIVVKSPLTALRWLSGTLEEATRIGEYQVALNKYLKQGMPEGEARRMAAFEARDRQDFAKGGAHTKNLRMLTPFWNASLQANVKLFQAFRERPIQTSLKGMAFITLPKLMEQALNWNDDDYWDRPQWERDLFFLIPRGKDANGRTQFIRLPVPFEPGLIFASLPGRLLQWAKQNKPDAVKDFPAMFLKNAVPKPIPPFIQVAFQDFLSGKQGWDIFRERPIVPDSIADLPPELQWTEQTSLTARKVGKVLGFSPMKVDHIISQTTGGLGKQITYNVIDRAISAMTGEKISPIGAVPGMRFLTTPAGISSQAVETFYQYNSMVQGDSQAFKKSPGYKRQYPGAQSIFNSAVDQMGKLRKQIRATEDQDKKQRLYLRISEIAKRVNKNFESRYKK